MSDESSSAPASFTVFVAAAITIVVSMYFGMAVGASTKSASNGLFSSVGCLFGYPIIGRGVLGIYTFFAKIIDGIFMLRESRWAPATGDRKLIIGACWPLTLIFFPIMLIAIILGYLYRSLWS